MPDISISLSRAQVREVDRRAIEEFGIPGIVLMENAGRSAAAIILDRAPPGAGVAIVCGGGNNGGDGFVIARHLVNAGRRVEILLVCDPSKLTGDAATNYRIVNHMAVPQLPFETSRSIEEHQSRLQSTGVIVDALLGTGFSGHVRPPFDLAINAMNEATRETFSQTARERTIIYPRAIAIDVPSGLDCDTGLPSNATLRAHETITFVARKRGFDAPGAARFLGEVHVADIGAPRKLIEQIALEH